LLLSIIVFIYVYCLHRDLHSFPTRRSSDLQKQTPFVFSYDSKKINRNTKLNFENKRGTVEDFLVEASHQGMLSFRQINHSIDVKDRKSTRLNSSHVKISYAVFCLKKKKNNT